MNDDSKSHRAELRQAYKAAPSPAGIYAVRNLENGKVLLGASPNAPGMLNRIRFQLEAGMFRDCPELQTDWKRWGAEKFAFEVLDRLPPPKEPGVDVHEELAVLLSMWRERLGPTGYDAG